MNESTTIIACRGNDQHAPLDALLNDLLKVRLWFGGKGLLAGADVENGDAAFQAESDRPCEVQLRDWSRLLFAGVAKKQRKHQAGTPRRESTHRIAASKDETANAGTMRIGIYRLRRNHLGNNVDGSPGQGGVR